MANLPEVTVVAATHNRSKRLGAMLEALANQTYGPERFEVVVVDDGSGDDTPAVLARAAAEGPLRMRHLRNEQPGGPAVARNRGWREATTELIAFTDDDCRPTPQWLEQLLAAAGGRRDVIVQGQTEPDPLERDRLGPFSRTVNVTGLTPHFETCNILYPRELLQRTGGFNESYPAPAGEDTDLGWRVKAEGATPLFAADAVVYHAVHELGPLGTMKNALLATDGVQAYKLQPQLREDLVQGIFYRRTHPLLLQAALAGLLARRAPAAALFALPWVANAYGRARSTGAGPELLPFLFAHDAIEVGAAIRGAIRHRILVF